MNRREFLIGAGASVSLAALPCRAAVAKPTAFGIISDTHVTGPESAAELAKAFRFLRGRGVSAVLHCGDVTDRGLLSQLDVFAAVWKEVFGKASPDLVVALGNRDLMDSGRISAEFKEKERGNAIYADPRTAFRERLGIEVLDGIQARRLGPVWVVSAAWKTEGGLEAFFLAHPEIAAAGVPIITLQHPHHQGTVFGGKLPDWAVGDARACCWHRMFPEAISFSGHSHYPNARKDALWRGDFAAVAAGSYCLEKGAEKGGREVSVLTFTDGMAVLERCDLKTGAVLRDELAVRPPKRRPSTAGITFMQWNLGHFAFGQADGSAIEAADAEARGAAFRRLLADEKPDIVGLCEYSAQFDRGGSRTRSRVFGDFAGFDEGPQNGFQCNAVGVRRGKVRWLRLKDYAVRRQKTYYLAEETVIGGRKTVVVQTHLDLEAEARAEQIAELVRDFADAPCVILSGDFNVADADEFKPFADAGFAAANGGSFGSFPTHRRRQVQMTPAIDNIFVRGWRIVGVSVADWPLTLSDHRPLLCRLSS